MTLPSFVGYRTPFARRTSVRLLSFLLFATSVLAIAFAPAAQAQARELRVAAAADLQPVMPQLAAAYQQRTGVKLVVSYGSSGALVTQIKNGAPFDVFFGADFTFPEQLVAAGLAVQTAPTPYARGTLVLLARKDSPLQPLSSNTLGDARLQSLAIADEAHAPYGRAAVAALEKLKLYDGLKPRLRVAENVAQAGQYAATGNAQAALISLTLARSGQFQTDGSFVLMPPIYPEIRQCAVILKRPGHSKEANDLLTWMLSAEVQGKLADLGLQPVT